MYRIIMVACFTFFSCILSAQSISYAVGYALPYSYSPDPRFSLLPSLYEYSKGSELYFSLGWQDIKEGKSGYHIRLSTYSATVFSNSTNPTLLGSQYSIRKYSIELEQYLYKLNLSKFGQIEFGTRFSYLFKSDLDGYVDILPGQIEKISSLDYDRGSRLKLHLMAKYSIGTIRLNKDLILKPTYAYNFSFSDDIKNSLINSQLRSHSFEVAFIKNLSPRSMK